MTYVEPHDKFELMAEATIKRDAEVLKKRRIEKYKRFWDKNSFWINLALWVFLWAVIIGGYLFLK